MRDGEPITKDMRVLVTSAHSTGGMSVKPQYLDARRVGAYGKVLGYVPGHGGDVWWVEHEDDGLVAAYMFTELEAAPLPLSRLDLLMDD